ncbi:MAG TPA: DUF5995 family protein [Mycobacteriales bacterium]|nr:DUF5995 family protein [Mycobacteriales bacterium]
MSMKDTSALSDIGAVVTAMEQLLAELPEGDGIGCFTRMYLQVTTGVRDAATTHAFRDVDFLTRLDVVFAGLFFDAVHAELAGQQPPHAWQPLFEARARHDVAPLQFALAGMNAHINRDLPVALVTVAGEVGLRLRDDSPEHDDFLEVNRLLSAAERAVKPALLHGPLAVADGVMHGLDDRVAMWDVARARDAAWVQAQTLQHVADVPLLRDRLLDVLDRTVGFASRGLLQPLVL